VTEPILDRDDVFNGLLLLADILAEVRAIRRLLQNGEEEDLEE
jgi:hypothetical protein